MRILTLVPPEAAAHVSQALAAGLTVSSAREVTQLLEGIGSGDPDVLVIDPRLVPPRYIETLIRTVRHAGTPVLAHTALTSLGMRALLALSRVGIRDVLIRGVDDDLPRIRGAVDRLRHETLGARVLAGLAEALQVMPRSLRTAVASRFVHPDAADTPARLAAQAGITRRSLDRWVVRSGIASTRLLVAAPRLLLAYDQLRQPDALVANVAVLVGYSSPRWLERQCQLLLGFPLSALRDTMPPGVFAAAMTRGLLTAREPERVAKGGRARAASAQ